MTEQNTLDSGRAPAIDLIRLMLKRKIFISIFLLFSIAFAIIFSNPYFMPPVYKSEVILFPPGTNSNKILIEKDPRFGSDNEIDEQIQIIKSGLVRDSIIRKYNLMQHYKIDTSSLLKFYTLNKEYESNFIVERTRYNSILIKVYDTDPRLACNMADDIVKISDHVKSQILKQNLGTAFYSLEKEYISVQEQAGALSDKVISMIGKSFAANAFLENTPEIVQSKERIDLQQAIIQARKNNQNSLLSLLYDYQNKLQQLLELRWSYDQAAGYINLDVPTCYVISPAEVNYKKDFPNRTMIVLLSGIFSMLLSTTVVLISEKLKNVFLH